MAGDVLKEQSDRIRSRMDRLRRRMDDDVEEIVENAQTLLDWRYYVRQFPLATIGLAAAAGFLMVPGHQVTPAVKLDEGSIKELAEQTGSVVRQESSRSSSIVKGALASIGELILRQALAAVVQQVEQSFRPAAKSISVTRNAGQSQ